MSILIHSIMICINYATEFFVLKSKFVISIGQEYEFFAVIRRRTMFTGSNPNEEENYENIDLTICSPI